MRSLAASLLVLGSCGSVASSPDAASPGADAGTPDAVPGGPLTVKVFTSDIVGGPVIGATVLFQAPDGTLIAEVATDNDGEATATIGARADVTVVQLGATINLTTVVATAPGILEIGPRSTGSMSTGAATINFTVYPGATNHTIYSPCGSSSIGAPGASVSANLNTRCGAGADLLALASNADGPLRYQYAADTALAPGANLTLNGSWMSVPTVTVTGTNPPMLDGSVSLSAGVVLDGFLRYSRSTSFDNPVGTLTAPVVVPAATPEMEFSFLGYPVMGDRVQYGGTRTAATTSFAFDLSTRFLPWISILALNVDDGAVSWTTEPGGSATPDLVRLQIRYMKGAQSYQWRVLLPGDATSYTLPVLPGASAAHRPATGDTPQFSPAYLFALDGVDRDQILPTADRNGTTQQFWLTTPGVEGFVASSSEGLF